MEVKKWKWKAYILKTPMHSDKADQNAGLHLLNRVGEIDDVSEII